jgi:hypothetical protein
LSRKFRIADTPKDPVFREFFDLIKSFPSESNAICQENAISCIISFLECCDSNFGKKLRSEITAQSIEKGLSAARAGTRQKTLDLLMILVEIDTAEPVVTDLLTFLNHKQPKLVSSVLNALTQLIK